MSEKSPNYIKLSPEITAGFVPILTDQLNCFNVFSYSSDLRIYSAKLDKKTLSAVLLDTNTIPQHMKDNLWNIISRINPEYIPSTLEEANKQAKEYMAIRFHYYTRYSEHVRKKPFTIL